MDKIVVIEDNHEMRENIKEILELSSYDVKCAENGKEGLLLIERNSPDLIICDIMMPVLDGYGVLEQLSLKTETSTIPFIFLTAKAEKSDFRKGMNLGADDYLTKPFEEDELIEAVQSRLSKKRHFESIFSASDKWEGFKKAVGSYSGLKDLVKNLNSTEIEKRSTIYSEGEIPEFLYFVEKGHVRNYKLSSDSKELSTGVYSPNDFFGYIDLLSEQNYSESSVAMEDSKITFVPKEDFESLLLKDQDISRAFIKLLAGNIIEKEKNLVNLAYNTVRKRVAEALVMLYDKYVKQHQSQVELVVSRDELASIVGTAKESVIRILSEFKNDGSILSKGATITILKVEDLRNCRF